MSRKARIILFLCGFAVLIYLAVDFGIAAIAENIARTGWWFLPIIAVWSLMYLCNALALRTIIHPGAGGPSLGLVYSLTVTGFALNYVTPLINLGGEPYRVVVLRDLIGMHRAVSSIILYNMVRMLSHFFFWFLGIALVLVAVPLAPEYVPAVVVVSATVTVLVVFFFSRHKHGIFRAFLAFLCRTPVLRRLCTRLSAKSAALFAIDDQIRELYAARRGAFYTALGLEFAARIIGSLEFTFIGLALGLRLSFADALYINAASSLIINLLFFIPFEVGAREGGLYMVMRSIGMPGGIGIVMGLVNRVRELIWILIGLLLMQLGGHSAARRERVDIVGEDTHDSAPV